MQDLFVLLRHDLVDVDCFAAVFEHQLAYRDSTGSDAGAVDVHLEPALVAHGEDGHEIDPLGADGHDFRDHVVPLERRDLLEEQTPDLCERHEGPLLVEVPVERVEHGLCSGQVELDEVAGVGLVEPEQVALERTAVAGPDERGGRVGLRLRRRRVYIDIADR